MDKEIKIENLAQTQSVIKEIKENFQKPENEQFQIVVRYSDDISIDDFIASLELLWATEIETNHTIDILIKNLSYEHRKTALGHALNNEQLRNPIFLMNVFCLIKGYNTFEDAYFEHEQVFLNDEVEFLDIFDDLEEEIQRVNTKFAEYYVSALKTCNLIEGVENNPNIVKIEPLYEYLFSSVDVLILAKILSSIKDPAIWETKKIVYNGLGYLGAVAEKFIFTNSILNVFKEDFLKEVKESIEGN